MSAFVESIGGKGSLKWFFAACLGLSFCFVTNGIFDSIIAGNVTTGAFAVRTSTDFYSGGITLIATCAVVALGTGLRKVSLQPKWAWMGGIAFFQVVSLAVLFLNARAYVSEAFGIAAGLVLACASVLLLILWARELAKSGVINALFALAFAYVIDVILDAAVSDLSSEVSMTLAFISALASPALLMLTVKHPVGCAPGVRGVFRNERAFDTPLWISLVCIGVYGWAMGSVQAIGTSSSSGGISEFLSSYAANIGALITACAIFLFIYLRGTILVMRISVLATLVAALYFAGLFGTDAGSWTMLFMTITRHATFVYVWMIMVRRPTSTRLGSDEVWNCFAFSLGWGLFTLTNTVSNKIGLVVTDTGAAYVVYSVVVIVALVSLIVLEVLVSRRTASGATDLQPPRDFFKEGCAVFGARFGLTPRELDVLEPLVRGRSAATIAQVLGVSTETARTHIRHIYQKTDIHSREDLMDEIEACIVGVEQAQSGNT